MNTLCFQGGEWEEICEKYLKFSKFVSEYDPGALDLMNKNDDEQFVSNVPPKQTTKQRTRAYRRKVNFKKLKRKRKIALQGRSYNPFKGYVDYGYEDGRWVPTGKYVKYVGKSNGQRYLKKKTNKRLRKMSIHEEKNIKGNRYRRESGVDYNWELY